MEQCFEVLNVRCAGCITTITSRLKDDFGKIVVNIDVTPSQIKLDIDDGRVDELRRRLREMGYPMAGDELNRMQSVKSKIQGLVSCAIGRFS